MNQGLEAGTQPISTLTTDLVIRVAPDTNLVDAARTMAGADVGLVVVGNEEQVMGVLSERDIVRAIAQWHDPVVTTVGEVAHQRIVWCEASASVAEVATEMMEEYVRHVLVETEGRLVGIVSARDLLGAYAAADNDSS